MMTTIGMPAPTKATEDLKADVAEHDWGDGEVTTPRRMTHRALGRIPANAVRSKRKISRSSYIPMRMNIRTTARTTGTPV